MNCSERKMDMLRKYIFAIISILIICAGCTVQAKLHRKYNGKSEQFLIGHMGKPSRIVTLENSRKMDVYEKRTHLRRTQINSGQLQYDPFESPAANKIETYKFIINSSGIIEQVQYDYYYEQ